MTPTFAQLQLGMNWSTFPTLGVEFHQYKQIRSAACFYAAGFYGRNDVVYVFDKLPSGGSLTLIDTDEEKLVDMHQIYSGRGRDLAVHVKDAWVAAQDFVKKQEQFDLVTVDPWSNDTLIALLRLPLWYSLARHALIIGVTLDWFADKHLAPTLEAFNLSLIHISEPTRQAEISYAV